MSGADYSRGSGVSRTAIQGAITAVMIAIAAQAFACTGFYVGKKVSSDGTTMIGRTVDAAPWNGPMRESRFERGEWTHADGTKNKYAFICASKVTSQGKGFYGGGAINEMGVMLSATVTGRTNDKAQEADPFVAIEDGGYGEPNLPDLMIGNAATAREAVEILGAKIADKGHSGPEIYMVADTNEAWYVEVYTARQWAAVRMPEDQVAVFGNQFNICEFNTNETENVMYSPNLVSLAVERDFVVWADEANGVINLYATYSPSLWDYANYRTYWGHNVWAPTEFPSNTYETSTSYPLFFPPEPGKKIALTDVFELMRTRYEGVNCPDENGDTSIRVIGTTKQQSCHVLQMRYDLPADYRCTLWECLAQAEHSTFLPVCMAVKKIPSAYSRDQTGNLEYDPERAADAFLRLDTLAELKRSVVDTYGVRQDVRSYYGAGVRDYWRAQEARLVAEWPRKQVEWIATEGDSGRTAATAYVNFNQVWALADAKRLHDELAWYWAEFNCDLRDGRGATDVPTYPFASSMPTNAELGASWTRWHRAEFDRYVEDLAGAPELRKSSVIALVDESKHVFDGVEDDLTLIAAKAHLQELVGSLCEEVEKPFDVPVITFFAPDFTEGSTSEVPNVSWKIRGPFDRVALTIDGEQVYEGDARCGEGRWRELSIAGIHRLKLTVGHGEEEVSASGFYTALREDEEPVILPRVGEFYSDFYTGFEGEAPYVHWKVMDIITMEIWVDKTRVLVTMEEEGKFRLTQLRIAGHHLVRIVARNVIEDAESSFVYLTEERVKPVSSSAPLQQSLKAAPVINAFHPDAYDAPNWNTPYIRWNLSGEVDLLQLTIDKIPVFIGDGQVGSGHWQDVSMLNLSETTGLHEVSLSVSNSVGVVTSNFTCTCYWEEPPLPPMGSEGNPWTVGENVLAYTNGFGTLVFSGDGATSNFTGAADLPWAEVSDEITSVDLPDAVTVIGANLWAGLGQDVVINGETIIRRKEIVAGAPAEDPAGAISPAEFERVEIVDGVAYLDVSVYTNSEVKVLGEGVGVGGGEGGGGGEGEGGGWGVATNGVIEVPAPGKRGFFILKSKSATPSEAIPASITIKPGVMVEDKVEVK